MKNIAAALLLFSMAFNATSQTKARFERFDYSGRDEYYNPSKLPADGGYFNPVISGWASDPSVAKKGNDYWLVTSTFGYFPGVPVYHSTDLVTWTQAGNVLSRPSQLPWLEGQSLGKGGIYAPAISYNPQNDTFYVITTCVTKKGSINFYVTAKDPRGPWSEPVVLEDVDGIDPSFFFDDNGKAYIVHKAEEHSPVKWSNNRALAIIEFDTKTGKTIGEPRKFREEGVGPEEQLERNEGAHIYKIDGNYYLLAAEGGTSWSHSEVCYKADNVWGPYRRWSRNPMLTQRLQKPNRTTPVTCTGHADIFQDNDGKWWAVFLGCRPWMNGSEQLGRETFMLPVRWSRDGFPYITQNLDTVASTVKHPGIGTQQAVNSGNFNWSDDFSSVTLRPEWMSLWGSPAEQAVTGNGLTLTCSPIDSRSGKTPAYIGRRIQHHDFEASTTVTIPGNATANDAAGILIVKTEQRQIFFAVSPGHIRLMQPGGKILSETNADTAGKPVGLKVICKDGKYTFDFRIADGQIHTLASGISASFTSSSAGGFTGTTIGLFATSADF
ncbi:glycoside hydrolase family 43 protein [Duncaniella sp.]|uniref:glycoside hydrolase family 43 protein n=1 Tax=Duncaniella TaxID=2518495 RepID=UPI00257DD21E|nr:glycoside hydrolase family 43 protein [Duncaniella sp.]